MASVSPAEADVLRCGYNVGYFDRQDIAKWADRQIAALAEPPSELLDLSINENVHPIDLMNLLRSLGSTEPAAHMAVQLGFIGLLFSKNRIGTERAIRALFELVYEPGVTRSEQSEIYYLDDAYDLARGGYYGTIDDVEQSLEEFLTPYAELLAVQCPHLVPDMQ